MQLIVTLLLLFIALNCLTKLSFLKFWQIVVFACLCGGFVMLTYGYALLQSKTQWAAFLDDTAVMSDVAVLITVESAICFGFCFTAMKRLFGERSRYYKPLRWYVSLLIFPVIFYVLTQLIFAFPGINFSTIAMVFALALVIGIPLLAYAVKCFLPEEDLRLEMHFLLSLFTAIIGLICTVNGDISYAAASTPVNGKAVALAAGIFVMLVLAGFIWYNIKWKIKRNKK